MGKISAKFVYLCLLLCLTGFADRINAVEVTFSDPILVDAVRHPVPIEKLATPRWMAYDFHVCRGPVYDLLMVNLEYKYIWTLVRVDSSGNPVDTIPKFLRPQNALMTSQKTYYYVTSIWLDPYFYIFESQGSQLYYTRISADLDIIDPEPVPFIAMPSHVIISGSDLWALTNVGSSIQIARYQLPDPSPAMSSLITLKYAGAGYDYTVASGMYFAQFRNHDSIISTAFLSPDGQMTTNENVAVPGKLPAVYESDTILPLGADSAVVGWVQAPDTGSYMYHYFLLSPDSATDHQIHSIALPPFRATNFFAVDNSTIVDTSIILFGRYIGGIFALVKINPLTHSLLFADTSSIPPVVTSYDGGSRLFLPSAEKAYVYYRIVPSELKTGGIHLFTFSLESPFANPQDKPLYFNSEDWQSPSLLTDSAGVLLYMQMDDSTGSSIKGCRFPYGAASPPPTFDVIADGSSPVTPCLFQAGNRKGLLWYGPQVDSTSGYPYTLRSAFFQNDQPASFDLDHQIYVLNTGAHYRPTTLLDDSLLYISILLSRGQNVWAMPESYVLVRSVNINHDSRDSVVYYSITNGSAGMVLFSDTLRIINSNYVCVQHDNVMCWSSSFYYSGISIYDGNPVRYNSYGNVTNGHSDWYTDVSTTPLSNDFAITLGNDPALWHLESGTGKLVPLIDFTKVPENGLITSGTHKYVITPVEIPDGYALFLIDSAYYNSDCWLMVFDRNWHYRTRQQIPLLGMVREISEIKYSPESDNIYFAYSSYIADPYASARIFLQSVKVTNVTDVSDDNPVIPDKFMVRQNAPNPFNNSTTISFNLAKAAPVSVTIYNILGQKVTTVVDARMEAGRHSVSWNGMTADGTPASSGIFFYRVKAGDTQITKKMILLK